MKFAELIEQYRDSKGDPQKADALKEELLAFKLDALPDDYQWSYLNPGQLEREYRRFIEILRYPGMDEEDLFVQIYTNNADRVPVLMMLPCFRQIIDKIRHNYIINLINMAMKYYDKIKVIVFLYIADSGDTPKNKLEYLSLHDFCSPEDFDKIYLSQFETYNSKYSDIIKQHMLASNQLSDAALRTEEVLESIRSGDVTLEKLNEYYDHKPSIKNNLDILFNAACKHNNVLVVKWIIEKQPELVENQEGLIVVLSNHFFQSNNWDARPYELIELLINHMDISQPFKFAENLTNLTPLLAAVKSRDPKLISIMIDSNKDINPNYCLKELMDPPTVIKNETALSLALSMGDVDNAKQLMSIPGIDLTAPDNKPLKYARTKNLTDITKILIQKGVLSVSEIKNMISEVPEYYKVHEILNLAKMAPTVLGQDTEIIKILIEHNTKKELILTPLWESCQTPEEREAFLEFCISIANSKENVSGLFKELFDKCLHSSPSLYSYFVPRLPFEIIKQYLQSIRTDVYNNRFILVKFIKNTQIIDQALIDRIYEALTLGTPSHFILKMKEIFDSIPVKLSESALQTVDAYCLMISGKLTEQELETAIKLGASPLKLIECALFLENAEMYRNVLLPYVQNDLSSLKKICIDAAEARNLKGAQFCIKHGVSFSKEELDNLMLSAMRNGDLAFLKECVSLGDPSLLTNLEMMKLDFQSYNDEIIKYILGYNVTAEQQAALFDIALELNAYDGALTLMRLRAVPTTEQIIKIISYAVENGLLGIKGLDVFKYLFQKGDLTDQAIKKIIVDAPAYAKVETILNLAKITPTFLGQDREIIEILKAERPSGRSVLTMLWEKSKTPEEKDAFVEFCVNLAKTDEEGVANLFVGLFDNYLNDPSDLYSRLVSHLPLRVINVYIFSKIFTSKVNLTYFEKFIKNSQITDQIILDQIYETLAFQFNNEEVNKIFSSLPIKVSQSLVQTANANASILSGKLTTKDFETALSLGAAPFKLIAAVFESENVELYFGVLLPLVQSDMDAVKASCLYAAERGKLKGALLCLKEGINFSKEELDTLILSAARDQDLNLLKECLKIAEPSHETITRIFKCYFFDETIKCLLEYNTTAEQQSTLFDLALETSALTALSLMRLGAVPSGEKRSSIMSQSLENLSELSQNDQQYLLQNITKETLLDPKILQATLKKPRFQVIERLGTLDIKPETLMPFLNDSVQMDKPYEEVQTTPFIHLLDLMPGSKGIIDALLDSGVALNLNYISRLSETALLKAMRNKQIDIVQKLIQRKDVNVSEPSERPIIEAVENGQYGLAEALYNRGARIPRNLAKVMFKKAHEENDLDRIQFLEKCSDVQAGSLFANVEEIRIAAKVLQKHFFAKPYNNGLHSGQWGSQRTVAILSNGQVIDVEAQYIYGLNEARRLASNRNPGELVTLDEIAIAAKVSKEKIGSVNIEALENLYRRLKVLKIVHKPNHEITHSLRTAAYISPIHQLLSTGTERDDCYTHLNEKQIEQLQLMMLFSVVGREDETGFADSQGGGPKLYQSYRAVSAIEFLKYGLDNWERHYKDIFSSEADLYRAALVIELMGFPNMPDVDTLDPKPLLWILMKGNIPNTLPEIKELIYHTFPNNNQLRSYTDEQLTSFMPPNSIDYNKSQLSILLNYMNAAHGADLLRCYGPGNPSAYVNKGTSSEAFMGYYKHIYDSLALQQKLSTESVASKAIAHFQLARNLLDIFGEKSSTTLASGAQLEDCQANAVAIEAFLIKHLNEKMQDIENEILPIKRNGLTQNVTFKEIYNSFNFDESLKREGGLSNIGKISHATIKQFVPRYISKYMLKSGAFSITPNRFDYCHYKTKQDLGRRFKKVDLNDATHHDIEKEIITTLDAIDAVERPQFILRTKFRERNDELDKQVKEHIQSLCGEGVAVLREKDKLFIEFSDLKSSYSVLDALLNLCIIERLPTVVRVADSHVSFLAEVSFEEYSDMIPYLKYRQVRPPKVHSVESELVDENGNISVLNLIQNCEATASLHNTRPLEEMTGVEWYFNQLEHPSTERPVRKLPNVVGKIVDRTIIYDQRTIDNLGKRPVVQRTLINPIPPEKQEPITRNQPESEYTSEDGSLIPRDVFKVRGAPKNSLFTKKNAQTLLLPNGRQRLFTGIGYESYFPIGIVSDVNELHLHGERYIWESNASTNSKFWIHGLTELAPHKLKSLSLKKLQDNLKGIASKPNLKLIEWNEMLCGNSKTAVKALLCPGAMYSDDNATLTYRLTLVAQAKFIKDKYHVDVPLIIVDGKSPPQMYTEAMIAEDIQEAVTLLTDDKFDYMSGKLKCEEQAALLDAFQWLTGITCETSLKSYTKDQVSVLQTNDENTRILIEFLKKLDLDEDKIKALIDNLGIVGGETREREYIRHQLRTLLLDDDQAIKNLLFREIVLGHAVLIKEILDYVASYGIRFDLQSQTTPDGKNAFELAASNEQIANVLHQYEKAPIARNPLPLDESEQVRRLLVQAILVQVLEKPGSVSSSSRKVVKFLKPEHRSLVEKLRNCDNLVDLVQLWKGMIERNPDFKLDDPLWTKALQIVEQADSQPGNMLKP